LLAWNNVYRLLSSCGFCRHFAHDDPEFYCLGNCRNVEIHQDKGYPCQMTQNLSDVWFPQLGPKDGLVYIPHWDLFLT
jgi:hypothetical protein